AVGGGTGDSVRATDSGTTFTGNFGTRGGAIYGQEDTGLTVHDSTFASNSSGFGGGIESEGTVTVMGTAFTENTAGTGGAIHLEAGGGRAGMKRPFSRTSPPNTTTRRRGGPRNRRARGGGGRPRPAHPPA